MSTVKEANDMAAGKKTRKTAAGKKKAKSAANKARTKKRVAGAATEKPSKTCGTCRGVGASFSRTFRGDGEPADWPKCVAKFDSLGLAHVVNVWLMRCPSCGAYFKHWIEFGNDQYFPDEQWTISRIPVEWAANLLDGAGESEEVQRWRTRIAEDAKQDAP